VVRDVRVIDGDTIEVRVAGIEERVRYTGIDTPEVGLPLARESAQRDRSLVEAREVWLERDVSQRDRYGRLRSRVIGSDPHRFDGDLDGVGCEG
jgi:micrococcal nuclease